MYKIGSILDYQQKSLDRFIWNNETKKLRPAVKSFIITSVIGFFEELEIAEYELFVKDVLIGSSLATYFYTNTTDLDIKIIIDIDLLKKYNPMYQKMSEDDILDELVTKGRESFWLTQLVPNSQHALDAYFYSLDEVANLNLLKYDALYSIYFDKWLKPPQKLPNNISSQDILDYAKAKAERFIQNVVQDIEKTKRDSIDFTLLYDYVKSLPKEEAQQLYADVAKSLQEVNEDIAKLSDTKEFIKNNRWKSFDKKELRDDFEKILKSFNYADDNLIFKLMQRYGYMKILSMFSDLIEDDGYVSPSEVEDVTTQFLH